MVDYRELGLFQKYHHERADGRPIDPNEELFSLRFDKNDAWGLACRTTLKEFADRIEALGYRALAADLRARIQDVEARITAERATWNGASLPTL